MVGISEYNLRFDILLQLARMHAFDRSERANGHKNGRFDDAMSRLDASGTGFTEGVGMFECESQI